MVIKPGHERCRICLRCGMTWCPDCDTEGKTCECGLWEGVPDVDPVDVPARRAKPRRTRQKGAMPVEYAMLFGFVLLVSAVFVTAYSSMVNAQVLAPGDEVIIYVSANTHP